MKIKTFFACALIASFVAGGTSETIAQKKAASSRTSSSKTPVKKTSSAGTLSASKLEDTSYFFIVDMGQNDQYLFQWLDLEKDNVALVDYIEDEKEMNWKVSGNTLTLGKGNVTILNATSTDGGKSFSGKFNNSPCRLYDISRSHGEDFRPAEIEKALISGKFITYLGYQPKRKSMILGFPVTVKFTPDEENPGCGTFKVTGDNKLLSGFGALKFDYEFGKEMLLTSMLGGDNDETPYNDNFKSNYFFLELGNSKGVDLMLYFIMK